MKVVMLGEIMLRLMTPEFHRIEQTQSFNAIYDGDEAIVATSLARFGLDVAFITKLPDNPFGRTCINHLRAQNVDCSYIVLGGDRLGVNFYETGVSIRPPRVIYDRKNSAFSRAKSGDFDFRDIFKDADWFHFAGITPALGDSLAHLVKCAVIEAKKNNVIVSCDLNYRSKLWSPQEAQSVMIPLMKYVDVCMGNEEDAEHMLGLKPKGTDVERSKINIDGFKNTFKIMKDLYDFKFIGCTLRESYSASDNGWSVLCYDGAEFCLSDHYDIRLVDRGGAGASFSAAFIYGLLKKMPLQELADFAGAASALKHTIYGGFNIITLDEVFELVDGNRSGRVQR